MYTLLDFDCNLPAYVNITNGNVGNKGAYEIPLLKGSLIVVDRFYNDFSLLNIWDSNEFFCNQTQRKFTIYNTERK